MDKQNLNEDQSRSVDDQQANTPKSTDTVPNLPDECGDSLWDPVLVQHAADLLQVNKADIEKKRT